MAVNPFPGSEPSSSKAVTTTIALPKLKLITKKKTAMELRVAELRQKRANITEGGGKQRIEKQHAAGKLTARERVDRLVDRGSFQEIGLFAKHRATYFGMAEKKRQRMGWSRAAPWWTAG